MSTRRVIALLCTLTLAHATVIAVKAQEELATAKSVGKCEVVARFHGPMPTGVTVSHQGRLFVNFPRWGDRVEFTVAEVKDGKPTAFPSAELNHFDKDAPGQALISVQSVVVDPLDRLWALDTGSIEFGPTLPNGPKLVGIDLETNKVFQTIVFPREVALKTTYLNDVRFDLRQGKAGAAYITDSGSEGPNGIIVVDLDSGRSWRRLAEHPSVKADRDFHPIVEGRPLMARPRNGKPTPLQIGSDGIAISADGKHLYYCPLASRRLYRIATDLLWNEKLSEAEVAKGVEELEHRGFASDGLESDAQGRLYLTDFEHNAVLRRGTDGRYETLAHGASLLWPDTLSLARNGFLYFTVNQLHRQKQFHEGQDLRQTPYAVLRVRVDAEPVLLRREP